MRSTDSTNKKKETKSKKALLVNPDKISILSYLYNFNLNKNNKNKM